MKKISRVAKLFIKKELKNQITFEAMSNYAIRMGYIITFYSDAVPNEFILKYNLQDYASKVHAFTFRKSAAKYIFIDSTISAENKLCSLAHELGHIVLKHMDIDKNVADERLHEMQAEFFAYTVLKYQPYKYKYALFAVILSATLIGIGAVSYQSNTFSADMVYITPTGNKYHAENCIHVKDKNCTVTTKMQASKNYLPCTVCNP